MGKAEIVSGGEDGRYTIKIDFGTENRDARVEKITERLTEIDPKIDEAKTKLQESKDAEGKAKADVKQATDDYVASTKLVPDAFAAIKTASDAIPDKAEAVKQAIAWLKSVNEMHPPASPEQVALAEAELRYDEAAYKAAQDALKSAEAAYKAAQTDVKAKMDEQVAAAKKLVEAKKETAPLQIALDLLEDERKQLRKDKAYWVGLELEETLQAWCADLTEDAEGDVATIEIPGENSLVLIKAGAESGDTVDGAVVAREIQSPEQVFWNAAVLPGWQKWKPTYRRGTITALDFENNTAEVSLDAEKSSAQKLDINQTKTLQKVPVIYMGCHAEAFEVGDACVVRFDGMDWERPQVVGFVDNPKSCPGGIGIQIEGEMLILRPPTDPDGGEWKSRTVTELNGGVAYAVNGGVSFVESGAGLCRSNKRVTGPIHGASSTPQLRASTSFPVSGLFISHGAVKQLMVSGDELLFGGRSIKGLPGGLAQAGSYALPAMSEGESWEMVSAAPKGGNFAVCRIGEEQVAGDAPPDIHVRAVAHYIETPGSDVVPASFELSSVQAFDRQVTKRIPDEAGVTGYAAPLWGEFSNTRDNNYDINRGTDNLSEYIEKSYFEADDIYRCYIGRSGEIFTDSVKRITNLSIQTKNQLKDVTTSPGSDWPDRDVVSGRRGFVNFINYEEVNFFGTNKFKTHSTIIDYKNINEHRGFADWWESVANVVKESIIEADISREINIVLVSDEDFSLVISIKAKLKYRYTYSGGLAPISASGDGNMAFYAVANAVIGRGDWANSPYIVFLPNVKTSEIDPIAVSLEVSGGGFYALDSGDFDFNNAKLKLENLTNWMSDPTNSGNYAIINDDGQGNADGFIKRPELRALEALLDAWVNEKLTDVMYAKDPKTGVGFLSFTWDGETKNYVVGPWGVEPSSTRTEVASDAKVARVVSV